MTNEEIQKIVDGAPDDVDFYCTNIEIYHSCEDLSGYNCCLSISDLRTQLSRELETLCDCDIPHNTIVLEG